MRLLLETAGVEVVGTACNGHELLELADRVAADVAVVDLDMPGVDGTGATAHLARRHPNLAVLVLTMHDDDTSVRRALHAGARGYVAKDAGHGAVVRAVHAVADGDTVLSGGVGRAVLTDAADRRPTSGARRRGGDRPTGRLIGTAGAWTAPDYAVRVRATKRETATATTANRTGRG